MSAKQHFSDLKHLKGKHVSKAAATEGGHCLNRHQARSENSCSHQWQAMKRAEEDSKIYDWPVYQSMAEAVQVFFKSPPKKVPKPSQGEWDVGHGENFKHCNKPYFNEAHHIVPNSTLAKAIEAVFGSSTYAVRGALLDAGYNLNYKYNMIILPLDANVAAAIGLPRHRVLPKMHHNDYSAQVYERLVGQFMLAAKMLDAHQAVNWGDLKDAIVTYAKDLLYTQIIEAGRDKVGSLDDMPEEWFDFAPDDGTSDPDAIPWWV